MRLPPESGGAGSFPRARLEAARSALQCVASFGPQAGTGTWYGPAPRGGIPQQGAPSTSKPAVIKEPDSVLLASGHRMPIIGLGTYAVKSVEVIK